MLTTKAGSPRMAPGTGSLTSGAREHPGEGREHIAATDLPVRSPRSPASSFDIDGARRRLAEGGGYEIVHESPGLEVGVYVLVAPEPDRQSPHSDDELYLVLEGHGVLTVDGTDFELHEGNAVFVPAGADHRFTAYEQLTVLVIFTRPRL